MSEMKDRLKELRKTLNLKQREVAERLDVPVGNVGAWEAGMRAIPSTRIYQLCKEYNVRREWLETGVGEMFEPEKELSETDIKRALFKRLLAKLTDAELNIIGDEIDKRLEEKRKSERLEKQRRNNPR